MAGIDASAVNAQIPLQTRTPSLEQALSPISTMLDITRKRQAVQVGEQQVQQAGMETQQQQIGLAQKQYEYGAQQRIGAAINDPSNKLPDGTPDLNKLAGVLYQADPRGVMASKVLSDLSAGKSNLVAYKSGYASLTQQQQDIVNRSLVGLLNDPKATKNSVRQAVLDQALKLGDDGEPMVNAFMDQLTRVPNTSEGIQAFLRNSVLHTAGAATLAGATAPSGVGVSTGAGGYTANTNPLAPQPQGAVVPGSQFIAQVPPTAQVFNQGTQQTQMVGPAAQPPGPLPPQGVLPQARGVTPQMMNQPRPQSALATSPPLTMPGVIQQVEADSKTTQDRAADAQRSIPVLQKIKQYAEGAATGVTSERESLISALAGRLGMDAGELKRTNTDVLAKNSNMLALAGGNTDLARTLAEVSNPNAKMTKEAINITADQLIASAQLDQAKQAYMQRYRMDPQAYTQKLAEWNRMSNPNAVLYPQLSVEERAKLKKSMNPQQQQAFKTQLQWAQQNGLIQ